MESLVAIPRVRQMTNAIRYVVQFDYAKTWYYVSTYISTQMLMCAPTSACFVQLLNSYVLFFSVSLFPSIL